MIILFIYLKFKTKIDPVELFLDHFCTLRPSYLLLAIIITLYFFSYPRNCETLNSLQYYLTALIIFNNYLFKFSSCVLQRYTHRIPHTINTSKYQTFILQTLYTYLSPTGLYRKYLTFSHFFIQFSFIGFVYKNLSITAENSLFQVFVIISYIHIHHIDTNTGS